MLHAQPAPGGEPDAAALRAELARLLREEASSASELDELEAAGFEAEAAAGAALASEGVWHEEVQELLSQVQSLELRTRVATEEEHTWQALVASDEALREEDAARMAEAAAPRAQELQRLREELAAQRCAAAERDREAERRRRLLADERCMRLKALLSFVGGEMSCSDETLLELVRDGEDASVPGRPLTPRAAERLLRRQREAHREQARSLVALCNEELRVGGQPSGAELLSTKGLPRILEALRREGIVDGGVATNGAAAPRQRQSAPACDSDRVARLRGAVLGS